MNSNKGMPAAAQYARVNVELNGKLVNYLNSNEKSKDYCDKHYPRRPISTAKPQNTARTIIPELQESTITKQYNTNVLPIKTDSKNNDNCKITNCERKHNNTNYSSNVFNSDKESLPSKPIVPKANEIMDRNIAYIGSKANICFKDRAFEPTVSNQSQNMKNFRDFRSCIMGMPGSTTSRQPLNDDVHEGYHFTCKQQKNISSIMNDMSMNGIMSYDTEIQQEKQGRKKFITKDALIYGTIEKDEKKPNELGRRGKGAYNAFVSHIGLLA